MSISGRGRASCGALLCALLVAACGGGGAQHADGPSCTRQSGPLAVTVDPPAETSGDRLAAAWSDMSQRHEITPVGVPDTACWKKAAQVNMGVNPYDWAVPAWWPGLRSPQWRAMVPWFTIYEDERGSAARNAAVEIDGIEMWVLLESRRQWVPLLADRLPAWAGAYALSGIGRVGDLGTRLSPAGGRLFGTSREYMVHGGLAQVATPWTAQDTADIRAIYVSVRHRLVSADPSAADDLDEARIGVQAGVDYRPWLGATLADMKAAYAPSAGAGRFLQVGRQWRYSSVLLVAEDVNYSELVPAPVDFAF